MYVRLMNRSEDWLGAAALSPCVLMLLQSTSDIDPLVVIWVKFIPGLKKKTFCPMCRKVSVGCFGLCYIM